MIQPNERSSLLKEIVEAGLLVQQAGESGPFANGYLIAKPKSIRGNSRVNYETLFGQKDIICDAPCIQFYPKAEKWLVEVWEYMPGPGPGDFQEPFSSFDSAVSFILDYYFGSPKKMNPPELNE